MTGHSSFSLNGRATVLRPQGGMWWRGAGFSKCDPFHARSKCDLDHARPPPRTFRCDVAKMAWSYCAILAHCYCDRLHRDLPWPAAELGTATVEDILARDFGWAEIKIRLGNFHCCPRPATRLAAHCHALLLPRPRPTPATGRRTPHLVLLAAAAAKGGAAMRPRGWLARPPSMALTVRTHPTTPASRAERNSTTSKWSVISAATGAST